MQLLEQAGGHAASAAAAAAAAARRARLAPCGVCAQWRGGGHAARGLPWTNTLVVDANTLAAPANTKCISLVGGGRIRSGDGQRAWPLAGARRAP